MNDSQIGPILEQSRSAGASEAFLQAVRLPRQTLPVFRERLEAAFPDRARKIENAILEMRAGKWNEAGFGQRMRGLGPRWSAIEALFEAQCRRLGLDRGRAGANRASTFRRPGQLALWEGLDSTLQST